MASKNPWGKARPASNPYAIIKAGDWEWRILKSYKGPQSSMADKYSRVFASVSSPHTFGGADLGDVYWSDLFEANGERAAGVMAAFRAAAGVPAEAPIGVAS